MLCTRMRLAERRYSLPRESAEGVPQAPGIIQRPCVIRNLSGNYDTFVTPRIMDRSKRFDSKKKPPLVVFSLKMQPGTKTLAQDAIKRDPRKLPTFCAQYKLTKKVRQPEQRPQSDLIIRGVEILSYPSSLPEDRTEDCDEYIPKELQIQLTDCCQCMRDFSFFQKHVELVKQQHEDVKEPQQPEHDSTKLGVHMGNSNDLKIVKPCLFGEKRVTTPRTRQIIKITMNSRKK